MQGDVSDSKCSWPAGINSYATCRSKPITPGRIQDHSGASNSWRLAPWHNTGRVFITRDFLAMFSRPFDRVPVQILTSDFHHRTLRKKVCKIRDYDLGVQFSFKFSSYCNQQWAWCGKWGVVWPQCCFDRLRDKPVKVLVLVQFAAAQSIFAVRWHAAADRWPFAGLLHFFGGLRGKSETCLQ